MFFRPKPRFSPGAICELHNGGHVVVKKREWTRPEGQRTKEWVYTVVKLRTRPETGGLLYSPHEKMTDDSLKWETMSA